MNHYKPFLITSHVTTHHPHGHRITFFKMESVMQLRRKALVPVLPENIGEFDELIRRSENLRLNYKGFIDFNGYRIVI